MVRFRLFPVRSPLLRESLLFSVPPGTKMFQFPGFASFRMHGIAHAGCPIRVSSAYGLLAANRSFSQLTTPFIAYRHLGIHRAPLVA